MIIHPSRVFFFLQNQNFEAPRARKETKAMLVHKDRLELVDSLENLVQEDLLGCLGSEVLPEPEVPGERMDTLDPQGSRELQGLLVLKDRPALQGGEWSLLLQHMLPHKL